MPPAVRRFTPNPGNRHEIRLHNIPALDLFLYARSYHAAAKTLLESLLAGSLSVSDVCPVLLLYQQALELHMKGIVLGEYKDGSRTAGIDTGGADPTSASPW